MSEKTPISETLQKAGDIVLEEVSICNLDGIGMNITAQVYRLDLFENIFAPFLTGTIFLFDGVDVRGLINISGKEILRIKYHTPVVDPKGKELEFFIYRASEKLQLREKVTGYSLEFISKEAIVNGNTRISKTFKGNASDIAREILGDAGLQTRKNITVDESVTNLAFISNFWKPTRCMRYLIEHSLSKDSVPDMVFYESVNGFNFRSLRSLIGNSVPPVIEYKKQVQENHIVTGKLKADVRNVADDYQHFSAIKERTGFDYFDRLEKGFYGGEIIGYDSTSHQYTFNKFNRSFDTDEHLNEFSPLGENSQGSTRGMLLYQPKRFNTFEGFEDVTNYLSIVDRKTIFERLRTSVILLEVAGRSDYYVGMKVELKIPRSTDQQDKSETKLDTHSSGRYLVSKIKHVITPQSHVCTLELTKDSYMHSLNVSTTDTAPAESEAPKRDDSISIPNKLREAIEKQKISGGSAFDWSEYHTGD